MGHALLLVILLSANSIQAASNADPPERGNWAWTTSIGTKRNLDGLAPLLEISGYKHVSNWGSGNVLVGLDLGLFGTERDNSEIDDSRYDQLGTYMTPTVRLRFGDRWKNNFSLETGVGWYHTNISDNECGLPCLPYGETYSHTKFGGYLGIGAVFGGWFIMGFKVHFTDFGEVTTLEPFPADLAGPIYTFSLGIAFGD